MKNFKILIFVFTLIFFKEGISSDNTGIMGGGDMSTGPKDKIESPYETPEIPTSGKYLEKTYTVMMEAKVDVFIPLEVVSDINIETTVVGNQIKEIPFEIELNRTPEKQGYYSIKYSETAIDIDGDGEPDTYIHSPQYINEKISKDNYVKIYGEKISKEGKHSKTIYVTVEVGE